jgi:hypothetical protein
LIRKDIDMSWRGIPSWNIPFIFTTRPYHISKLTLLETHQAVHQADITKYSIAEYFVLFSYAKYVRWCITLFRMKMICLWDGRCCSVFIYVWSQNILNNNLFERHLTIPTTFIILDCRNPASPAAEKKRRQRLKMSQEKKDAQREKERLSKNAKRQVDTQEDSTQRRKINC